MEDRLLFLEKFEEAAEEYSCDAEDGCFEVYVKITCEYGCASANVIG